jgi:O-antigen/teichoic acid export membrane protein
LDIANSAAGSVADLTILRQQTIRGIGWSGAGQGFQQAFRFVLLIVLARLLEPEDFGLVGMVAVFTGFASVFQDGGFGAALVHRQSLNEAHRSSVFWINILTGVVLAGILAAGAPIVARFYGEPTLALIITVTALDFVLRSFGLVQAALLKKHMRFRDLAVLEACGVAVGGIVGVGAALYGFGVWSLVFQTLAYSAVRSALLWVRSSWRPEVRISYRALKELVGFSMNLLGFNVFRYWVRNADNLIIGKFLGSAALGVYTRAYSLMLLPVTQMSTVVGRVMFPALARLQHDLPRMKRVFLQANRLIALVTVPMMLGLVLVAEPFVITLLGAKWVEVIPVLQVLALVGVTQPMTATTGWLYTACGKTRQQFHWGIFGGTLSIAAFLIGVRWGVVGVATAYLIRTYLLWYPAIAVPGSFVRLDFREYLGNLLPVFGCGAVMAVGVAATDWLLGDRVSPAVELSTLVGVGAAVYLAVLVVAKVDVLREFVNVVASRRRGPTRRPATARAG